MKMHWLCEIAGGKTKQNKTRQTQQIVNLDLGYKQRAFSFETFGKYIDVI